MVWNLKNTIREEIPPGTLQRAEKRIKIKLIGVRQIPRNFNINYRMLSKYLQQIGETVMK